MMLQCTKRYFNISIDPIYGKELTWYDLHTLLQYSSVCALYQLKSLSQLFPDMDPHCYNLH